MRTKRHVISAVAILMTFKIFAQSPTFNVNFPSPNVSSLGLYNEVPVSLHNGTVDIAVPIYTIKEGPITLPVSLNYHTTGVRPDVHPGWVGNGWNLDCGGMIHRTVKGVADEAEWQQDLTFFDGSNSQFNNLTFVIGSLWHQQLNNGGWATESRLRQLAEAGTGYSKDDAQKYYKETDADEFTFNFNGYSGKFYFDEFHAIKVVGRTDLKIEAADTVFLIPYVNGYVNNNLSKPYTFWRNNLVGNIAGYGIQREIKLAGFRITTPDGIQYEFGLWNHMAQQSTDPNIPIESSVNFFQQIFCNENWDTWYLRRIVAPDGHAVSLVYGSPQDSQEVPAIATFGRTIALNRTSASSTPTGMFSLFGPIRDYSSSITSYHSGQLIFPRYLTQIVTSKEIINFNITKTKELTYDYDAIYYDLGDQITKAYDHNQINERSARWYIENIDLAGHISLDFSRLNWEKLDKISIISKNDMSEKFSWNFTYTDDPTVRLSLLSLEKKGVNISASEKFAFHYIEDPVIKLPPYLSFKTDHWGFYNGKTPDLGDLSASYLGTFFNSKTTDPAYLQIGTLDQVTYPTGGYTKLIFEPNKFTQVVHRDETTGAFSLRTVPETFAGGLRIKSVISSAGNGQPDIVKRYEYTSGISSGEAVYYWPHHTGKLLGGSTFQTERFVSETVLPVSNNSVGSHIGYSKVKEYINGNGYTESFFSNYDLFDENFIVSINPDKARYMPASIRDRERGMLQKKISYNEAGNPLEEIDYTYEPADLNSYVKGSFTNQVPIISGAIEIEGTAYKKFIYPKKLIQIKNIKYNYPSLINQITTKINTYEPMHGLLKSETFVNSKGETRVTDYSYPFDVLGLSTPANDMMPYSNLIRRNNFPVINTVNSLISNGSTKITSGKLIKYGVISISPIWDTHGDGFNVAVPFTEWRPEISSPLPSGSLGFEVSTSNGIELESISPSYKLATVYSWNSENNLLNLRDVLGGSEYNTVYLWGYKKQYPIAQCKNAKPEQVGYANCEEPFGLINGNSNGTNLQFSNTDNNLFSSDCKTGLKSYNLTSGNFIQTVAPLPSGTYILSYWVKGNGQAVINSANTVLSQKVSLADQRGWRYVEAVVGISSAGYVYLGSDPSGNQILIDDIRIYPVGAQMTTYTYDPLVGITSVMDDRGETTFYEYDGLQRLINIRDRDGNIVKHTDYHYAGQL